MVFPQFSSQNSGLQSGELVGSSNLDSITLGQLKTVVGSAPKPRVLLPASLIAHPS
jgi:hypothetical protein